MFEKRLHWNVFGKLRTTWEMREMATMMAQSASITFEQDKGIPPFVRDAEGAWLKPNTWKQGGYDAVYIMPAKGSITFVQLATAKSHELKTEFFHALLTTIDDVWDTRIKYLEICFLVPANRAETFKVKEPTKHGCFENYYVLGDRDPN
jgi:hypothetical protein